MKKKLAASAVLLAFALTACGGSDGRPSQDDIAGAIKDQLSDVSGDTSAITDDVVDCIAKEVHDSDLSDSTLNKMVNDDKGTSGETDAATKVIAAAATKCVKA